MKTKTAKREEALNGRDLNRDESVIRFVIEKLNQLLLNLENENVSPRRRGGI